MSGFYYVHILKSLKTSTCYYGSTSNLEQRLHDHNTGKIKHTKARHHWDLYYSEKYSSKEEAMRRELFFNSPNGYTWLKSNGITFPEGQKADCRSVKRR